MVEQSEYLTQENGRPVYYPVRPFPVPWVNVTTNITRDSITMHDTGTLMDTDELTLVEQNTSRVDDPDAVMNVGTTLATWVHV